MAKAPIEGAVKTRLIGTLSPADATDLYINFLCDTVALMEEVWSERESLSLVLCYWPEGEIEAFEKVEREGSLMLAQRGDGLGERIINCLTDLFESGFDSIVIIGADSPTLPIECLTEAFENLTDDRTIVIGPAEDQGYYLIGMTKLHRDVFREIPWGTGSVLTVTQDRAREADLKVVLLAEWYDVDTLEDLDRLKQELSENKGSAGFTRKFLKELARRGN